MVRYNLEFKRGCETFATMTIDLDEKVDVIDKAIDLLKLLSDGKPTDVDVFTKGKLVVWLNSNQFI